ncbi:hypothetical protein UFOVP573_84 [uncultured Caudovirales phage]|jgi:hypothetical protein|uniref:Uncharacterized protein n=1 Tax=uncultured Caudovirales phage TaxID=2100421 RepID=A0A6J5PU07_9CAUD|nr:hypothetical protein UFOVP288_31 [uncultured Caudovirales phage]CAB4146046.1 hypothetical protein UFOVP483_8 [uncultured Caudovirales phage]CAB4150962.1 hypothetical protein UFOVP573_84 [uncultured Caudovirales phage]CAB4161085.1 hypothetical protein UFOVP769_31 [uncultured Caudovirales phage]CAB4175359.1 hypothetical protein UFOVP962_156 [uncultured Caudovirales phage]
MEVTGLELIKFFKESCKKSNKLFIPDSPRQESVADALAEFYKKEELFDAVKLFIKSKTGPFLVFDFAIESRSYVDKTKFESKSVNAFKEIVEQTKKRMESE